MNTININSKDDGDEIFYTIKIRVLTGETLTDYTKNTILSQLQEHQKRHLAPLQSPV